jgi:hypothetical protein
MENRAEVATPFFNARSLPGWATSTIVHAVVLTILLFVPMKPPPVIEEIVVEQETINLPTEAELVQDIQQPVEILPEPQALMAETPSPTPTPDASVGGAEAAVAASDSMDVGNPLISVTKAIDGGAASVSVGKGRTDGFSGRGSGKGVMLGKGGGTLNTEFAVKTGLDWFLKHQFEDGHWEINYTRKSTGATTGVGEAKSNMAATSLALLPFLAGNHTHQTGQHKAAVKKALNWMIANQGTDGRMLAKGDQHEMYTHALASIVLCEAYALTKDRSLQGYAQKSLDFSAKAQNKQGGWRYGSKSTDSDTSVFGWQFMAMKSGLMGGLKVNDKTLTEGMKYLKTVQSGKNGGLFAYEPGGSSRPSMTAIGLLCHQYMGKGKDDPAIDEGVKFLVNNAPPERSTQPYYWYYATQVVHHYQGPEWERWNRAMRRIWVEKQNRDPKSTDFGSWDPKDFGREQHDLMSGGRLYLTSIGLLTLEVYYRYLPLYEGIKPGEMKSGSAETKTAAKE